MTEYLAKYTKNASLLLADEFETKVWKKNKNKAIIQAIVDASDYDESYAKIRVKGIFVEGTER